MKRLIVALMVGGALFAAAFAAAANLNVTDSTAASGSGPVASCGDVTGTTFILLGETINEPGAWTYLTGNSSDPRVAIAVNIETVSDCDQQDVFVLVDGTGSTPCTVHAGGGLGWNEGSKADNTYGCTAVLNNNVAVASISTLTVTMR